jgi:hypothetical protein
MPIPCPANAKYCPHSAHTCPAQRMNSQYIPSSCPARNLPRQTHSQPGPCSVQTMFSSARIQLRSRQENDQEITPSQAHAQTRQCMGGSCPPQYMLSSCTAQTMPIPAHALPSQCPAQPCLTQSMTSRCQCQQKEENPIPSQCPDVSQPSP